jgi:hypothetical protein
MLTETEFNKAFKKAVNSFVLREIERKSLARQIAEVKPFDLGGELVIEREDAPRIEVEPQEFTSYATLPNEYVRQSDFDMIRAFFENLAHKMANLESQAMIREMTTKAGTKIDAKGDILGGFIEAAKQMREKGNLGDLEIIANQKVIDKLGRALQEDQERAKLLRKLLSGKD